ncbi:hypothetical protein OKW49_006914 [Paraburkholderia youngii]
MAGPPLLAAVGCSATRPAEWVRLPSLVIDPVRLGLFVHRLGLFDVCPEALAFVHEPVLEGRHRTDLNVLRRSPVANVLYFPFSEAPPITVGGRRKGPVGRRPRCRASQYRVRCRTDPVADRSRAGHDGGAKNAGHVPLHDVGQIADALYALLSGAVFVWARSAPRRSCRPSPSRGASVKSRANAVHWPCIRSRPDGSTGSTVVAVRCSSCAFRTLCRSTSPPRCSTLCCCRWLHDSCSRWRAAQCCPLLSECAAHFAWRRNIGVSIACGIGIVGALGVLL